MPLYSLPDQRKVALTEALLIMAGLLLFWALAFYQITLPGIHYDEAVEVVPAMQILLGQPTEPFRGAGLNLAGRTFPLMVVDYIGALNTYLVIPFFAFFGISVFSLRLMSITIASLTLLLTYRLARKMYNRRVATVAYLLLAVHPSFVFWARQGVFVTLITTCFTLGSLVSLLRWRRQGKDRYLYLTAFLLGLGLYAKFLFLWFILAAGGAWTILNMDRVLVWLRQAGQGLPRLNIARVAAFTAAFLLGASMLILFNIQTSGTVGTILNNLVTSYYGTSNLALASNLGTRLDHLRVFLNGGHFWYLGGIYVNDLYLLLFTTFSLIVIGLFVARRGEEERWAAFPILFVLLLVLQSCFTVSALWVTHYAILLPWPQLVVAVALDLVTRRSPWGKPSLVSGVKVGGVRARARYLGAGLRLPSWPFAPRTGLAVVALATAVLIGGDLWVDLRYHQALSRSGGQAAHSAVIYQLADYLDQKSLVTPVAVDWGIKANIQFLTHGRVNPIEIFGYEWETGRDFRARLAPFLDDPDNIYIFHSPEETVFPRRQAFEQAVSELGKAVVTAKRFFQPDGRTIFLLLQVVDQ
ncbi:MAG: glycosyltransferase family 39 protein [Anaerolineae bacterium]